MFRSTARNLRTWWTDFSDDILGADLPATPYDDALDYHLNHPHRQPLSRSRPRREGTVPPRPAHCLSPVRGGGALDAPHHVVHS
jgi:hypothetical protein